MPELTETASRQALIEKLLVLLPSAKRTEAAALLERNDAQSRQMLKAIVQKEQRGRRMRAGLLLTSGIALCLLGFFHIFNPSAPWYMSLAGIGGLVLTLLSPLTRMPTRLEQAALEVVVLNTDKQNIGTLLEAIEVFALPAPLQMQSRQALISMLHSLTPEDAALLSPADRSQLARHLNYAHRDDDLELRLAAMTALQNVSDPTSLGTIFKLAIGEAATHTAQTVRQAARDHMEHLLTRLDFGPLEAIPEHIQHLTRSLKSEEIDFQVYAFRLLALRRLLPQLTAETYRGVLSEQQRDALYYLLTLSFGHVSYMDPNRVAANTLREVIIQTARRLRDVRALPALRNAVDRSASQNFTPVRKLLQETLPLLEAQVEKEKESRTLLRGSSSPAPASTELLRAAAPAESNTAPGELLRASTPYEIQAPVKIETTPEQNQTVSLQRTETPGR